MTTRPKLNQPSSPREFFERLYGDLETEKRLEQNKGAKDGLVSRNQAAVVTPIPLLAAPLPFSFPTAGEAHLAAGLSAFRK